MFFISDFTNLHLAAHTLVNNYKFNWQKYYANQVNMF